MAEPSAKPRQAVPEEKRWITPVFNLALVFGLLAAVSLLPPDTSLAEVERTGALRVCIPSDYPPLVIGNTAPGAERRGIEVDLLTLAAERMGLRLVTNVSTNMGRDINPRNWRLTRAQCNVIAGGVLATYTTRSYLDTTIRHLETGWVALDAGYEGGLDGAVAGVFPGFSGFDRIALSQFLRNNGVTIRVMNSGSALTQALASGEIDIGITEAIGGRQLAETNDLRIRWLSDALATVPVTFGLWKGDLTLKRAIEGTLEDLAREGLTERLLDTYALIDIEGTLDDAPVSGTVDTVIETPVEGQQL